MTGSFFLGFAIGAVVAQLLGMRIERLYREQMAHLQKTLMDQMLEIGRLHRALTEKGKDDA